MSVNYSVSGVEDRSEREALKPFVFHLATGDLAVLAQDWGKAIKRVRDMAPGVHFETSEDRRVRLNRSNNPAGEG